MSLIDFYISYKILLKKKSRIYFPRKRIGKLPQSHRYPLRKNKVPQVGDDLKYVT